jgi:hypothetical protein
LNEYEVRYEPHVGYWWPYSIYVNGQHVSDWHSLWAAKRFIRKHKKLAGQGVRVVYREGF